MTSQAAAVGLAVSTGRVVVVVVRVTPQTPKIVVRYEIHLADPWVPESLHPYHYELGDFGPADTQARRRGCQAASKTTCRAIHTLVGNMRSHQLKPQGACVVVSSLVDPLMLAREHPRAHAQEGKLYREAVEAELRSCRVPFITVANKDLLTLAAKRFGQTATQIKLTLKAFSREVGTPWRAPEKQAAVGGWIALCG